jgi:hypothetical protein
MIQALTQFITGWGPIAAQQPVMVPLAFELMKFGLGGFKAIRPIEDAIDQAASIMNERAQQGQFQPPPSPDAMRAQADIQVQQSKAQAQVQIEQQKAQTDAALDQHKAQTAATLAQQQAQHEAALAQQRHEHELALREQDQQHRHAVEMATLKHKHDMEAHDAGASLADVVAKVNPDALASGLGAPLMQAVQPLVEGIGQALQQLAQGQQQTMAMQVQMQKEMQQVLQIIAQSANAPRRRIAIRDGEGRIVEAHDMPMQVQ